MRQASRRKYHYIYRTTCKVTGKYYLGMHSTDDLNDGYLGSGKRLWYSINKHGKENHVCEILEFYFTREWLREREAELVCAETLTDPMCMNLKAGGDGGWELVNASDTKGFTGRKHSVEAKQKIKESATGRTVGDDTRKKISESNARTNIKRGEKVSNALTGKAKSSEHKANIAKSLTGRKISEETREKMSKQRKGRNLSEETKRKISEALKNRAKKNMRVSLR